MNLGRTFVAGAIAVVIPLAAGAAGGQSQASDDAPGPFVKKDADQALQAFASQIEDNYLFPNLGNKYAELLRRKAAAGEYSTFRTDRDFTRAVEADLNAVQPDLHLHIIAPSVPRRGVVGTAASPTGTCPNAGAQIERSIGRFGWLAPGIAYVEFCAFRESPEDRVALRSFLDRHSKARVLIVDNRNNNGGGFAESDLLFSRLFDRDVGLLELDIRKSVDAEMPFPFADGIHWKRLSPKGSWSRYLWYAHPRGAKLQMRRAKVYVLTSRWTESAGEGTTLALKVAGRALVIGERTQGAGHLAPTMNLPGKYRGQVPIGRVYDPRTGIGFEGNGVSPNVKVPAADALSAALKLTHVNVRRAEQSWSRLPTLQK